MAAKKSEDVTVESSDVAVDDTEASVETVSGKEVSSVKVVTNGKHAKVTVPKDVRKPGSRSVVKGITIVTA